MLAGRGPLGLLVSDCYQIWVGKTGHVTDIFKCGVGGQRRRKIVVTAVSVTAHLLLFINSYTFAEVGELLQLQLSKEGCMPLRHADVDKMSNQPRDRLRQAFKVKCCFFLI